MRKLTLQEIQQTELEILVKFDRICAQEKLRYSLDGGTLLGAIRHKGFIPWDDDIDLMMPRPDYIKLKKVLPGLLPDYYKFISDGHWPFSKIVDLRTKVSNNRTLHDFKHIWIDIFPVDGLPNDKRDAMRVFDRIKRLRRLQYRSNVIVGTGATPFRAVAKIPFILIPKIKGAKYYTNKINRILAENEYASCEWIAPVVGLAGTNQRFQILKESFSNRVKVSFCNRDFWAVSNWDEYLTGMYGDYMKLPPENERISHYGDAWQL